MSSDVLSDDALRGIEGLLGRYDGIDRKLCGRNDAIGVTERLRHNEIKAEVATVENVRALCATVRALWVENKKFKDRLAEQRTQNRHLWQANREIVTTNTALRDQLAQVTQERDGYANALESATRGIKCDD